MYNLRYRLTFAVLTSMFGNAWCQCTCTTIPQTHEYINLHSGHQFTRILHHSVCMAIIEPVVIGTPFDLSTDFTAEPCCCKAYWRHVPSLGRGDVVYVKNVYHCEVMNCST